MIVLSLAEVNWGVSLIFFSLLELLKFGMVIEMNQ